MINSYYAFKSLSFKINRMGSGEILSLIGAAALVVANGGQFYLTNEYLKRNNTPSYDLGAQVKDSRSPEDFLGGLILYIIGTPGRKLAIYMNDRNRH